MKLIMFLSPIKTCSKGLYRGERNFIDQGIDKIIRCTIGTEVKAINRFWRFVDFVKIDEIVPYGKSYNLSILWNLDKLR